MTLETLTRTSVIKTEIKGCTFPVNEPIIVNDITFPYYDQSDTFKINESEYVVRSVPIHLEMDVDSNLYLKLYHIFLEAGGEENNFFYAYDEAYWTLQSSGKYKVKIDGEILGGEGIYKDVEGKLRMTGMGEVSPCCPSFYVNLKIQVDFKSI